MLDMLELVNTRLEIVLLPFNQTLVVWGVIKVVEPQVVVCIAIHSEPQIVTNPE